MGMNRTIGMLDAVADGLIGVEDALHDHVASNIYPPLPARVAARAAEVVMAVRAGELSLDDESGVLHRDGRPYTVRALIKGLYLAPFIEENDE